MEFFTTSEMAEKWDISRRRVTVLIYFESRFKAFVGIKARMREDV